MGEVVQYFTLLDLKKRNTVENYSVSLFGDIYDLTGLIRKNRETKQADNMLKWAGQDITHFFDPKTKNPKQPDNYLLNLKSKREIEKNQLFHFDLKERDTSPWYQNNSLVIGKLTKREIKIKIVNTLSYTEDILIVPIEETLNEICDRYLKKNFHAKSYVWKDLDGRVLKMDLDLYENNLGENLEEIDYLDIPEKQIYIPSIFLYFKDDLTIR